MPEITWKRYEKDLNNPDPEKARIATEAFIEERDRQTKTSQAARQWENDRVAELKKNKPKWVKEKRKSDQVKDFSEGLRSWMGYDSLPHPCPNYLIVKTDEDKNKTESGIILQSEALKNNIGICLAIGGEYIGPGYKLPLPPPCKVGDKIMFKIGAGIEVEVKDKKYKFMQYSDVLGIF